MVKKLLFFWDKKKGKKTTFFVGQIEYSFKTGIPKRRALNFGRETHQYRPMN